MKDKVLMEKMPWKVQDKDHFPLITYKLEQTIRSKIFNYKETIANVYIEENNQVILPDCKC